MTAASLSTRPPFPSGASAALVAGIPLMWLVRRFASPRWRERAPALLYAAWLAGFIWLYRPILPV